MSILQGILFPKDTSSFIATIISKQSDNSYLVKDGSGRQYKMEASQIFAIGSTVLCKNGVIIRSTGNKIKYKNYVV